MNGEHKRSSADVMVTQTTLIKRLFILSVTGLMLMCGGCFSGMSVYAQNATSSNAQHAKKISGVVIDSNGEPIIGAAVLVQGTSVGVATDVDGKFSLDVPSNGKTLVVSYIGYDNQEVPITSSSQYKITLSGTNYALDEVVVTALGMKREKKALGYSVQDVKGDALIENRTANIATSLNGKVAGMNISATSIPGGSNRIVIRGNNSISGNNMPLVVVDGVPFDNTQGVDDATTNSWGTGFSDTGDGLSMLNPDDVESISVLKGPSATALYGSRGGNGVILVTTKKGQGGKTLVSYNSNFTFENVMIQPEFQNEYGQGTGGAFDITSRNSWGPKMGTVVTDWTGQTRPLEAKNNDFSDFMNTGTSWTNSVDVTGSAAKMNYRVGLSNTTRKGVIPNNSLSKNNFSVRAGGEIIKNLTLDAKVNYTYQKGKGRPEFSASGFNPIFALIYTPRSINLHEMKNIFDEEGNILDWYSKPLTVVNNPYAATSLTGNQDVTNRVNGFASLTYDISSWLKAMVRFGGDVYLQSMMRLQSNGQTKETVAGREEYYTTGKGLISQGVNVNTGLPNTVELDPTTYWGQFYGNIGNYIYDTTNVRLRELNLTWTLPDKWFAKTIIRGLKLSAVANNVCFLYNNLPGFDPECTYSTGNGQGIETASLPSTRSFGFNLNVTF